MSVWIKLFLVGVGGGLGANARYWLGVWVAGWAGNRFPWATFLINLTGACLLGFLVTLLDSGRTRASIAESLTLLLMVGFLGGYTTFSTYSLEAHRLWLAGQSTRSLLYLGGSALGGVLAVAVGASLASLLNRITAP